MAIQPECYELIRSIDVDAHRTQFAVKYWQDWFKDNKYMLDRISAIIDLLGESFTRTELVDFYRLTEIGAETKFIAAMIWGHEAAAGGRRDSRGPWKVSKMFSDTVGSERAIRSVSVSNSKDIAVAYSALNKALDRCGPNFFTKHFYFLGKSMEMNHYPVILDDRVANGLLKLSLPKQSCVDMVSISAVRKPAAYISYLDFVHKHASLIGCEPDQIEYYLFNL